MILTQYDKYVRKSYLEAKYQHSEATLFSSTFKIEEKSALRNIIF